MKIQLSDHFNFKKLLRFTVPSIIMMVFTSIYGVVDGLFVSNLVGETEFSALNFITPATMIVSTLGFMFGTGGSALVAKTLGEGDKKKANELFSLFVYLTAALGAVVGAIAIIFVPNIAALLGATGKMLDYSVLYGRTVLCAMPFFMLQVEFHSFAVTAEKPKLGLYATVSAGVGNMVLDALFMAVFKMGLFGAALATGLSQFLGAVIPLVYFLSPKNDSLLHLGKTHYDGKAVLKACTNGSSEFMSNVSMSLVGMLYNVQLLKYAGEQGVAAYGVLMYVNFVFISTFIGYSIGTAPIVGYHFGAKNKPELKNVLLKSSSLIGIASVVMLCIAEFLKGTLAGIFVGYNEELFNMTVRAFEIFSFSFLFAGMSIFGSSFFTALNDGVTSALISFLRTLVFQIAAVLLLPLVMGLDGIWFSVVVAEFVSFTVSLVFIWAKRKKFGYLEKFPERDSSVA